MVAPYEKLLANELLPEDQKVPSNPLPLTNVDYSKGWVVFTNF